MRSRNLSAFVLFLAGAAPLAAQGGTLTIFATGEDLATGGFQAPKTTRDGWTLSFDSVIATFGDVTAWRTDPPFMADGPVISGDSAVLPGTFTVNLAQAGADDRIALGVIAADPGHYNALAWALLPAPSGDHRGYSLVFEGQATRGDHTVAFVLRTADTVRYACGEYIGDTRKGFVTAGAGGDLEITLHLDHLFGRQDKGADDPMNLSAPGFDSFATGGIHEFSLAGIHLGHAGEGHCFDTQG